MASPGREPDPIAEVAVPCPDLDEALAFFTQRLGFRLDGIRPADAPREALVSGHGLRLRLEAAGAPATDTTPVAVPTTPVVTRMGAGDAAWRTGRAGMLYRDLVPDRRGGRLIASHIRIEDGGPVPDYVHFHEVSFQMITCVRGWVKVVYEDQGPPFVMNPGDCVLQPPGIRHRVLECSPGLEVVEISSPAEHATLVDHDLELPTPHLRPDRDFGGQRFVRHVAARTPWTDSDRAGFEERDLGIRAATAGLATARVLRAQAGAAAESASRDRELTLGFVLAGGAILQCPDHQPEPISAGDALCIPSGLPYQLAAPASDFQLLEVGVRAVG